MDEDESHDGCVECRDVAAVHTVAPLDVGALDAVDAVEELRDLDLGGAHLVRVALAHREVAVRHGDFHRRVLGLAGVGGDLLVEETPVVFAQALGALARGQGDAEGARVGPGRRGRRVGEDRLEDLGGNLLVCKGTRGAARGGQGGKVVHLNVECHAPMLTRLRSPDPPGPPTGRLPDELPGQSLLEGHHILLGRGPGRANAREVTAVGEGLPDAVAHLVGQALVPGLVEGHEGQVGRRVHSDDVAGALERLADPRGRLNGGQRVSLADLRTELND